MQGPLTMQTPMQPFIKLAQSNMALLTQFSLSPGMVSQAMANTQALFQREPRADDNLALSHAMGQLVQGLLKNYTDFFAELGQGGMTLWAQGQAALLQQASEAAAAGSNTRGRRSR